MARKRSVSPCGEYVTGIDPLSGGMDGCTVPAGELKPSQTKCYDGVIRVIDQERQLQRFIRR